MEWRGAYEKIGDDESTTKSTAPCNAGPLNHQGEKPENEGVDEELDKDKDELMKMEILLGMPWKEDIPCLMCLLPRCVCHITMDLAKLELRMRELEVEPGGDDEEVPGSRTEKEGHEIDNISEAEGDSCGLLEEEGLTTKVEGSLPPQEPVEEPDAEEENPPPNRDDPRDKLPAKKLMRTEEGTKELMNHMRKMMKQAAVKEEQVKGRKEAAKKRKESAKLEEQRKQLNGTRSIKDMMQIWGGGGRKSPHTGNPRLNINIGRKLDEARTGRKAKELEALENKDEAETEEDQLEAEGRKIRGGGRKANQAGNPTNIEKLARNKEPRNTGRKAKEVIEPLENKDDKEAEAERQEAAARNTGGRRGAQGTSSSSTSPPGTGTASGTQLITDRKPQTAVRDVKEGRKEAPSKQADQEARKAVPGKVEQPRNRRLGVTGMVEEPRLKITDLIQSFNSLEQGEGELNGRNRNTVKQLARNKQSMMVEKEAVNKVMVSNGRKRKKVEEALTGTDELGQKRLKLPLSETSERDKTIMKYLVTKNSSFENKERPVAVQDRGGKHEHLGGGEGELFPAFRKPSSTELSR